MSRRLRTLELLTAADLAKSDLAREQAAAQRDIANTNRWIGALSGLVQTGTGLAQTAYGAAEKGALEDAKTFASQNPNVRGGDDVNDALDADASMQAPKSTGNWVDDFVANPFGVKGALAAKKRSAATQLLNEQAGKNRAADKLEADRTAELARQDKLLSDKNTRDDKIRNDDIAIADRRRQEDAELQAFRAAHDDEERAKDRRAAAADRAAERAARVQAAQAEANARAAQRAEDKAAAQAQRDAEYQRDQAEKKKKYVVDIERTRANIKNNIALLRKQMEESGTYEVFGPESANMDRWITDIATDRAKLKDPTSVVSTSEVEREKKGLIPTGGWDAFWASRDTNQAILDHLEEETDQRADNAYRVIGLPPPSEDSPPPTSAAPSPSSASDPMMLVVAPDGASKLVPRSRVPPNLPVGWTATEAH